MRRAAELKNITELNLSARTLDCLKRKDLMEPNALIKAGRVFATDFEAHPELIQGAPKWQRELVSTLDLAGFIRHDIYPHTYHVWQFYHTVLESEAIQDFTSTELYEKMPAVTDEELDAVMSAIETLTDREARVISMRFGLEYDGPRDLETISQAFFVTQERIRQIENKAIWKLRHPTRASQLPPLFGFVPPETEQIMDYPCDDDEVLSLSSEIDGLKLDVRTYYCLRRAGIDTIADLLNFPPENLSQVEGLNAKTAQYVVKTIIDNGIVLS